MDRRKSSLLSVMLILLAVAAILGVAVAGILSTRRTTIDLGRSATRNECARQINADLEETFRRSLAEILDDAFRGDRAGAAVVAKRMKNAPNAADEINAHCPAPIAH